ncbi:WxL domain-containing protein [Enterococcus villorum]|uniref:WxL domain-containing protein n=1 Tax=Enterococcus villorum TaxID=112904 RepID=UPI003F8C7197
MKKTVLVAALYSAILMGGTVSVHADNDTNGKSTAKIGLKQQDPDDPIDPIGPIDNDDTPDNSNDPTGNTGILRVDYISNINFGEQTISGKVETYRASTPKLRTEAQVSDLRGSGAGWHLQVNYDTEKPGFVTTNNQVLKGAELTFPAGTTKSTQDNQSAQPVANTVIVGNEAQNIMDATSMTGLGTWVDDMNTQDITLKVPSGNMQGDYTATLVWTLTDAPA